MPQCVCCVQVNRSPKYTTDRLETKQYSQLSKQLAYTQNKQSLKSYFTQAHKMPQCICCVRVNRSPKYTTDRLEKKQYTQISKLLAYTQNKQSLKSYFTQAHKMPQCICCVQVNRSPKYTTDRLETKQYSQLSKLLAYTQNKQSLKSYFTQAHKCPSASAVYR